MGSLTSPSEVEITYAEFTRIAEVDTLKSYGHEFRICNLDRNPRWFLYKHEVAPGNWVYYQFHNKYRVYHRWECHARSTPQ